MQTWDECYTLTQIPLSVHESYERKYQEYLLIHIL